MVTDYEASFYRSVERIEQHLHSTEGSMREMAAAALRTAAALELIAKALEDPPMQDPPDTSWVETTEVKRDYGR